MSSSRNKLASQAGGSSSKRTSGTTAGTTKDHNSATGTTKDSATTATDRPDEDPLVAVVLADSYDDHFAPLTLNWPRCLLPLANVPLLHYAVESATQAGVAHVYVLTRAHAQLIRQHVKETLTELLLGQGIGITVVSTPEALSEADALRELDAKQVLRADFLLYRSDAICTMDLRPVVEAHRRRRVADKDAIMTMCCMPVREDTPMRSRAMRPVHYVDPTSQQLVHFEVLNGHPKRHKAVLPLELLRLDDKNGFDEIDVRYDLVDAGVYVCSIDVPPLFSENFDYQSLLLDFVPGILTSDLLDSKIFLHVGKRGYGGRAQDTQTYDAISRDVLRRWASPLTPASSAWLGERLTERRGWRYVGRDVRSDRTSNVGPCSMIASRCTLGPNTTIVGSILCEGVEVGQSSTITDSHIHTSAVIGSNVTMSRCIVGRDAKILDNVKLGHGCLIGAGCIVGPDVALPDGSRVGSKANEDVWDEDEEDKVDEDDGSDDAFKRGKTATLERRDAALGAQSRGVLWANIWHKGSGMSPEDDESSNDDEVSDDEGNHEDLENLRLRAIGYTAVHGDVPQDDEAESVSSIDVDSELGTVDEDDNDSEVSREGDPYSSNFSNIPGLHRTGDGAGMTNLTLADEGDTQLEKDATQARIAEFEAEARASLARALEENHSIDNASLELKTLRMASNVAPNDVQRVVVNVLLDRCSPSEPKQVQALVTRWGKLIAQVSQNNEIETLTLMQSYCATHATHTGLFVPLLKLFYNEDVVSDESIVAWWRSKASQTIGGERALELRNRAQGVVRYILESDDEDDDDDDD